LANAIKLLTRVLIAAERSGIVFRLSSIDGGSAHNAIPREAKAQIVVAPKDVSALNSAVENANQQIQTEWNEAEPNLCIERRPTEIPESVMGMAAQKSLLHLLYELPHGVQEMSEVFLGKVQTSTNLSRVETREQEIEIAISSRSFVAQKLDAMQQQIRVLGECCGARVEVRDGYPGWEPDADSHLLRVTRHAYETVYGKLPRVEVVHAGLECGVLVAKKPTLEAISFGPLIRGAHSPDEHVVLSTVGPIWKLLTAVLEKLA
jgi:dipeptidase D